MYNNRKKPTETKPAEKKPANGPTFYAYSVSERGEGEKAFWNRVGAFFAHQRGEGGTLILDAFPVNGRVVLLPPKAEEAE